jgi:uncharacterized membrane protein YdbT with pleckstrin-like domain
MKIEQYKDNDEKILWYGKPNKSVFIKERIFTPLALLALIWLIFDIAFMSAIFVNMDTEVSFFKYAIIPFMILHLMPVWLYLGRVIFSFRSYKNTEYMVTDKAIYATSGVFTFNCERKTFQEVTNVSFHQGIIDKVHNVGDVFIATGQVTTQNGRVKNLGINIIDIEDYLNVYKLINKTSTDIYSDTMYPNDLRPNTNHGYKTEYINKEE